MTAANFLTVLRIALIPVFILLVLYRHLLAALGIFFLAGISDVLDGLVARVWHQRSLLGSFLDPIADRLLLSSSLVVLGVTRLLPLWVVVLVLARDLVIMGGLLFLLFVSREFHLKPSMWGKVATAAQGVLVFLVLAGRTFWEPMPLIIFTLAVVVITTVVSAFQYISLAIKVFLKTGEGLLRF